MDGYETCKRIREHSVGRRAFIIAITGWGQDGDKLRATESGFDAHLTKPADPAVLERLLAEAARPDLVASPSIPQHICSPIPNVPLGTDSREVGVLR